MLTDLKKLRHVVEVARAESFTAASVRLAISQSALTKSIADVEHRLELKLFQRLARGVRLTQAGRLFVPRAERILADAEDLMGQVGDLRDLRSGRLRLGVAPGSFVSLLESPISEFARAHPGLGMDIVEGSIDEIAQALIAGQLDIGVGSGNYLRSWQELSVEDLAPLRSYFIARLEHPVLRLPEVTAPDLLAYPVVLPLTGLLIDEQLRKAYVHAGVSPVPPQYVCDHFALVQKLVEVTDAISPVVSLTPPGERFRGQFQIFENVVALDPQLLGVAFARSRNRSPAAIAFARALPRVSAELS